MVYHSEKTGRKEDSVGFRNMDCSWVLIVDDNKLIAKALQVTLSHYLHIGRKDIRVMPDKNICSKDEVSDFLRNQSHKYNIILNANCSFSKNNLEISYEGIRLLQMIYENYDKHNTSKKPIIISFQSLRSLKNNSDSSCKILLRNEQFYSFHQLPIKVDIFSDLTKKEV